MQFVFESRDPQAGLLREIAEQRLRFALRRASSLLPRAKVQLSDLNGPRGGVDKRCRLELTPERGSPIVIVSTASNWRQAFENALARGARALVRSWQRRRDIQRDHVMRKRVESFSAPTNAL
ncbi:MAG: HPF/RaiA family ribosome-associated protein [Burkholderiaceae bacterium]